MAKVDSCEDDITRQGEPSVLMASAVLHAPEGITLVILSVTPAGVIFPASLHCRL